jgi:hypothetical protein
VRTALAIRGGFSLNSWAAFLFSLSSAPLALPHERFDFSGQILLDGCRPEPEGRSTVNDDQHAAHPRLKMTWQIANEFIFSGPLDHDILAGDLACIYLHAKTQGRHEKAVLRFSSAVVENQRDHAPGGDPNRC